VEDFHLSSNHDFLDYPGARPKVGFQKALKTAPLLRLLRKREVLRPSQARQGAFGELYNYVHVQFAEEVEKRPFIMSLPKTSDNLFCSAVYGGHLGNLLLLFAYTFLIIQTASIQMYAVP